MAEQDLALIAHLLRRAGFGASREELEAYAGRGYAEIVEELLAPEQAPDIDEDVFRRYHLSTTHEEHLNSHSGRWIYRMINSRRPLVEKMTLFWHGVFATGWDKGEHTPSSVLQIETFRRHGLSDLRTILLALSKDPAMIFWLDNSENHRDAPNENYGRELMELFSMGVGNYSEQDIKAAARAFTGWTFEQPIPLYPYGHYPARFVYRPEDHDDSVKTFLGETGRFDGADIVDIIVRQPATPRFIARHLYNFFVADEPQVPAWPHIPPSDPEAIEVLVQAYLDSDADMRSILRVLFNSRFFKAAKDARFTKVKSPVELVVGTIKLTGMHRRPEPELLRLPDAAALMGQRLLNPPTVEGWHTGREWIDGGTLTERINFAVNEVGDATKPGVQAVLERIAAEGDGLAPEAFVARCLELAGPLEVGEPTRAALLRFAESGGELRFGSDAEREASAARVARMLQLIVASREYQFA
jgi:uncharacterized protein (DUF1800 family)